MKKLGFITLALIAAALFAVSAFAASKTLTTSLSGKSETPKGDPNGKGTAKITLNTSTGKVCFKLSWSGIDTPTASHIHQGKKGVAGPVVVPIFAGSGKHSGCVKADKKLVGKIAKSPGSYYVNIHTKKYPAGALRGQL
jgi:CHRD domain